MAGRTYVIGDIHGAVKALRQLIERIKLQKDDKFIFIGDYVDGWSESAQVIDYVMDMDSKFDCIFIKGNHDAWCETWLDTGAIDEFWQRIGGQSTMDSYREVSETKKAEHLTFFRKMKMYYIDEMNRLFVHGGFTSTENITKERHPSNYYWDRTLWEVAVSIDPTLPKESKLYPKRLAMYKEIYIGHTPTLYYDITIPMHGANVWNVDTGAGFMGRITALDIESKEYVQSDVCQSLYPDEMGRNKR